MAESVSMPRSVRSSATGPAKGSARRELLDAPAHLGELGVAHEVRGEQVPVRLGRARLLEGQRAGPDLEAEAPAVRRRPG